MPVAREKAAKRRTASTSSDCGGTQSGTPIAQAQTLTNSLAAPAERSGRGGTLSGEWQQNEVELECSGRQGADAPPQCCSPKGCVHSELDLTSPEAEAVKVICSNEKCPYSGFMHLECFVVFEEQVLSFLRGMSRARNWSEKQRKQNLWTKKGYDLVYKVCTCRCGKGTLKKDLNYVPESGDKTKKKRKKSTSEKGCAPSRLPNGAPRTRSRSGRNNSDSFSSENGIPQMQPFAHRTDYSVFQTTVPRHLVNSYHIKMEDDGYGAGDDTRSFVLSSLAFHHTSFVTCVLCTAKLTVYDQYPLLDGTFYLSPLKPSDRALEVESKGDDPLFLAAVCLKCLVGINTVYCGTCSGQWNGNCHQIGTMYSYDIFAALPCCPASVQCKKCKRPLGDPSKITLSFSQLSAQIKCSNCGSVDYHFVKPISRFQVQTK